MRPSLPKRRRRDATVTVTTHLAAALSDGPHPQTYYNARAPPRVGAPHTQFGSSIATNNACGAPPLLYSIQAKVDVSGAAAGGAAAAAAAATAAGRAGDRAADDDHDSCEPAAAGAAVSSARPLGSRADLKRKRIAHCTLENKMTTIPTTENRLPSLKVLQT